MPVRRTPPLRDPGEGRKAPGDLRDQDPALVGLLARPRENDAGKREQAASPERAGQKMQPVRQLRERQVSPVGRMARCAPGERDEGPCAQH
jgi:hypothetical protein